MYTTNQPTLTLLSAIQSVPLVDIGDVYQVVDGASLTVHNKVRGFCMLPLRLWGRDCHAL